MFVIRSTHRLSYSRVSSIYHLSETPQEDGTLERAGSSSLVHTADVRYPDSFPFLFFSFLFFLSFYTELHIVIPRFAREIVSPAPTDRFDRND